MTALYRLLLFMLLSLVFALPVLAVSPLGNWTTIPSPEDRLLEAITVSDDYLWGIDNRTGMGLTVGDNNVVYCRRPCSDAGSWMDAVGQLDQTIDASETEVWGVNDRGQVYKRPIDGSGGWVQITGKGNDDCVGKCFSDASVSSNGYIWALSNETETYRLCSRTGVDPFCGNNDQLYIDNEPSLVHIEAGDEEVWAVDANLRIFKRPVDGSGKWSSVPGEMRYISASGTHVWGIAPNDSLYVCMKPCNGCWQYIGGSFEQVDGGENSVFGVTTNGCILTVEDINCSLSIPDECSPVPTTPEPTRESAVTGSTDTITISLASVISLILLLLVMSGITVAIVTVLRKRRIKEATRVKYISGEGGYLEAEDGSRVDGGFDNRVYSNRSSSDPEYDSVDSAENKEVGSSPQSERRSDDFRNRMDSVPNTYAYSVEHSTALRPQATLSKDQIEMQLATNDDNDNYEVDGYVDDKYCEPGETFGDEYDYADEKEFWEPASQEKELKMQVEKLTEIPVIERDALQTHEELGSGQFGIVYRGVWQQTADSEKDSDVEVAVKTMEEGAGEEERVKFLQEAAIMGQFRNHPNIVKILGIILDAPYKIVTELMHRGDLHHYLVTLKPDPDQPVATDHELGPTLLSYTRQIALGLMYLSFKKFVHRDIAARNILVNDEGICKIADFGLSRDLLDENYYVSHGGKVPVKWTAPEAINYRKYSMASDVWSYGCLLFEIWSLGVKPFHDVSNKEAVRKIDSGYRLPPPPGCPKAVYQIMIKCWHPTTASRPSPSDIVTRLSQPDFQILKWSQKDLDATSERARTLGAPLAEGHALYKGLQQTYNKN